MRGLYLAASVFGLSLIASFAAADGGSTPETEQKVAAAVEANSAGSSQPLPVMEEEDELSHNPKYQDLLKQKADLDAALAEAQTRLRQFEAEVKIRNVLGILGDVAERYPDLEAGRAAALLLEALKDPSWARKLSDSPASPTDEVAKSPYIDFGQVVVNLDEGRLSRYLQVKLSLQVASSHYGQTSKAVLASKVPLQDALLKYLADKSLEDIRGSTAQDRMRQEIRDRFNTLLFPDGSAQIEQVLFEQFVVQ
jgi:flagellar basal body-associated protein FliL